MYYLKTKRLSCWSKCNGKQLKVVHNNSSFSYVKCFNLYSISITWINNRYIITIFKKTLKVLIAYVDLEIYLKVSKTWGYSWKSFFFTTYLLCIRDIQIWAICFTPCHQKILIFFWQKLVPRVRANPLTKSLLTLPTFILNVINIDYLSF